MDWGTIPMHHRDVCAGGRADRADFRHRRVGTAHDRTVRVIEGAWPVGPAGPDRHAHTHPGHRLFTLQPRSFEQRRTRGHGANTAATLSLPGSRSGSVCNRYLDANLYAGVTTILELGGDNERSAQACVTRSHAARAMGPTIHTVGNDDQCAANHAAERAFS